jgi:hypothetical protein
MSGYWRGLTLNNTEMEAKLMQLSSSPEGLEKLARAIRGQRSYFKIVGKTFMHSDGSMWIVTETRRDMPNGYLAIQPQTGASRLISYYQLRKHYASIQSISSAHTRSRKP